MTFRQSSPTSVYISNSVLAICLNEEINPNSLRRKVEATNIEVWVKI